MKLPAASVIFFLLCAPAMASEPAAEAHVDLRAPHALENLQKQDPAAFQQIQQIIAGLEDQPDRVESDWLQVNFNAQDIEYSKLVYRTSLPPVQLLRFTVSHVRYTLYVTRADVVGSLKPAH